MAATGTTPTEATTVGIGMAAITAGATLLRRIADSDSFSGPGAGIVGIQEHLGRKALEPEPLQLLTLQRRCPILARLVWR
jgi:hypothetical protein